MVGWAGALFAKQPQPGRAAHPAVAQTESAGVASLKTEYYIRIRLSRKFYEKRYSCGATESRISVHLSPLSTGESWILPRARTLRLHSFSSRAVADPGIETRVVLTKKFQNAIRYNLIALR